jgi:hypothetical protein
MAQSKSSEKKRTSRPPGARGADLADEVTQAHQAQVNQLRHEPIPASNHSDRRQESSTSSAEVEAERRAADLPAEAERRATPPPAEAEAGGAGRPSRMRRGYRARSPRSAKST